MANGYWVSEAFKYLFPYALIARKAETMTA